MEEANQADAAGAQAINRKRRLSKKERKNLKKQKTDDNTSTSTSKADTKEGAPAVIDDFMKTYEAIQVPAQPSKDIEQPSKDANVKRWTKPTDEHDECGSGKTLGKWFPNAQLVKCSVTYTNTGSLLTTGSLKDFDLSKTTNPKSSLVLFYQYTEKKKKWSQQQVKLLMTYLSIIAEKRNIGGRIRVAQEGVNATLSAVDMPTNNGASAIETLRHVIQDLKNFDPIFGDIDFKFIDELPPDRHFKELRVIPVEELVFYGIREEDAACGEGGVHLDAIEYHEMLKKENTVVIDVRNHYEAVIGRFDGQEQLSTSSKGLTDGEKDTPKSAGAEYIDPKMRKSTDFTKWLGKSETQEKLKGKQVLMFCTGGIRCERASAFLKKQMGDQVDGVYQLQGGVERYLKAFPEGGFWRGKNFVFDKREAISAGDNDGDGGVIRKEKKGKKSAKDDLPATCCICDEKWDRYIGKKKCFTCGVPVLMCEKCMSDKLDKAKGMELKSRCPLCIEENITVPASEVEFTDNGVKNKKTGKGKQDDSKKGKAAESVLKWGGGHASNKKLERKMNRRLCQFGKECFRKDCNFAHPEKEKAAKES